MERINGFQLLNIVCVWLYVRLCVCVCVWLVVYVFVCACMCVHVCCVYMRVRMCAQQCCVIPKLKQFILFGVSKAPPPPRFIERALVQIKHYFKRQLSKALLYFVLH